MTYTPILEPFPGAAIGNEAVIELSFTPIERLDE
jgi:hypothetical protein